MGHTSDSALPDNLPQNDIPPAFTDFFRQKIVDIRDKIGEQSHPLINEVFEGDYFSEFKIGSENDIREIICKSSKKSCSLDPLPCSLLITHLDDILPIITNIVNLTLSSGNVPLNMKHALVTPLLKKKGLDKNELKNYRPVSNLPYISKIAEKAALKQLNDHLDKHQLYEKFQSAYRPYHSTETTILKVTNDILTSVDDGNISILILLDLSSAFDTIDHSILLERLEKI